MSGKILRKSQYFSLRSIPIDFVLELIYKILKIKNGLVGAGSGQFLPSVLSYCGIKNS